ncbi:hypothetical protein IFR05_010092 [Cadophora sp. M221]|nr:hypothetical protein IFR05_010092 [Cadophora sp. M221]
MVASISLRPLAVGYQWSHVRLETRKGKQQSVVPHLALGSKEDVNHEAKIPSLSASQFLMLDDDSASGRLVIMFLTTPQSTDSDSVNAGCHPQDTNSPPMITHLIYHPQLGQQSLLAQFVRLAFQQLLNPFKGVLEFAEKTALCS